MTFYLTCQQTKALEIDTDYQRYRAASALTVALPTTSCPKGCCQDIQLNPHQVRKEVRSGAVRAAMELKMRARSHIGL